ncbi:hypothetical protein HDU88_005183 [Geranomyces variabilis]|nr:hypothetical protein HDU88_005183 [Geranomyces variabilis]
MLVDGLFLYSIAAVKGIYDGFDRKFDFPQGNAENQQRGHETVRQKPVRPRSLNVVRYSEASKYEKLCATISHRSGIRVLVVAGQVSDEVAQLAQTLSNSFKTSRIACLAKTSRAAQREDPSKCFAQRLTYEQFREERIDVLIAAQNQLEGLDWVVLGLTTWVPVGLFILLEALSNLLRNLERASSSMIVAAM